MTPGISCGFTGIETFLISILSAFVSAVVMVIGLTSKFALKSACKDKHDGDRKLEDEKKKLEDEKSENINKKLNKVISSQALQFKMLRSIIIHMPLDPEKKDEILNMTVIGAE